VAGRVHLNGSLSRPRRPSSHCLHALVFMKRLHYWSEKGVVGCFLRGYHVRWSGRGYLRKDLVESGFLYARSFEAMGAADATIWLSKMEWSITYA